MNLAGLVTLVVYSYSSFVTSWGPGPEIAKKFEATCNCKVKLVDAGDGGSMLGRVKLEGSRSPADMVIGVEEAFVSRLEKDLGWDQRPALLDSGPLAFVYKRSRVSQPPKSLDDLLDRRWKNQIVIQDPRFSSVGLGFLLWVLELKGQGAWDYLKKLKPQLKMITPNWDLAYGMFKKDQTLLVLSYWTSPAYHIQEEKNFDIAAAEFSQGHYVQKEYLAINPRSQKLQLAQRFAQFLVSQEAQQEVNRRNFMYPANDLTPLTEAFLKIGKPSKLIELKTKVSKEQLDEILKKWRAIFS
ncbi:MAG: thiamine ABC transporter substrate-binding protein [Oligoflexia bacterium]|nr:thiamine ABC transporter substrate-binding protein [Oligoflexia bacterium]